MSHDFMFPLHTFDILKHMSALDEYKLLEMTFSFLVTLDTNHVNAILMMEELVLLNDQIS